MSASMVAITGTFANIDGTAAVGSVEFRLTETMTNGDVVYTTDPTVVPVLAGALAVTLPANDDPATVPTGTGYVVTENIGLTAVRTYQITVPSAAAGAGVDLSTLMPGDEQVG